MGESAGGGARDRLRLTPGARRWIVCVALLLAATLGQTRPYVGDEAFYQVSAIRMIATGDLLVPVFDGAPRFQKPILPYWFTAIGHALCGVHLWSGRLAFVLLACVLLWVTGRLAALLLGGDSATVAVMVLASLTPFVEHARVAVTDLPLTCFSMLALFALCRSFAVPGRARWWTCVAFVAAGLACASKGPMGVLPVVAFTLWLWRAKPEGYREALRRCAHPGCWALLITVGFSWYAWVAWWYRDELLRQFAIERAANVSAGLMHVPGHLAFYAGALIVYALPWLILCMIFGRRHAATDGIGPRTLPTALAPVGWYLGLAMLTLVVVLRQRDARYLLVAMPGLALYVAALVQQRGWARWVRPAAATVFVLHVAFFIGYRLVCGEPLAELVRLWERQPTGALAEFQLPPRETGWLLALSNGRLESRPASASYVILDERSREAFGDAVRRPMHVIGSARVLREVEWRGSTPLAVYRTYLLVSAER
jgi:4-amino-4-deoxy-L-arabinose transferase-like glycosyltransferase